MGLGSRIRDPEKNYSGSWIQGSKRHCIPCIKFASAGDRTRVACVIGGHSTLRAIKTIVDATHLYAREGSHPPPPHPKPAPTSWNLHHNTTQQYGPQTTVWALDCPHLHLHKTTYWPLILMCPCIIDFIGGMDYLGEWGGGDPGHSWALKWHERSNPFPPVKSIIHGHIRISGQ